MNSRGGHLVGAIASPRVQVGDLYLRPVDIDVHVTAVDVAEADIRDGEPGDAPNIPLHLRPIESSFDMRAPFELAMHRHGSDRGDVVEVGNELRRIDAQLVVEAERYISTLDSGMREGCPNADELDGVAPHAQVRGQLCFAKAEDGLSRRVGCGAIVDSECVGL